MNRLSRAARWLWHAIVPADVAIRQRRLELLIWSFVLSLAYYPGYWGVLAWFALVRPLMIISKLDGRAAFNASYFFGFFFCLFSLYWVGQVTPPGMIAAVSIVAFYYALMLKMFSIVYNWRKTLSMMLLPFLWVGLEYFRTLSQFAFPWADIGYTQAYFIYILQFVSIASVHGISFLIVAVNVLLWQVFQTKLTPERRLTCAFLSIGIVAALCATGWARLPTFPVPGDYQVSLLQGAVPIETKWSAESEGANYKLYDSLVTATADTGVKLYVWPETAAPCYLERERFCRQYILETAGKSNGYHLVGALGDREIDGIARYYNSVFLVTPSGEIRTRYDKTKLVPFAETVPYQSYLPFLRPEVLTQYLTFIKTYNVQWWSDFLPGDSIVLFDLPDCRFGVLICFESTFPEFVRQMVVRGSNFLVATTNDTWFEGTVGLQMHARMLLTRAVENRIWIARCANSGLSFVVDDYGRVWNELPLDKVAAGKSAVRFRNGDTFFSRHGDLIGHASFLLTASLAGILLFIWLARRFFAR